MARRFLQQAADQNKPMQQTGDTRQPAPTANSKTASRQPGPSANDVGTFARTALGALMASLTVLLLASAPALADGTAAAEPHQASANEATAEPGENDTADVPQMALKLTEAQGAGHLVPAEPSVTLSCLLAYQALTPSVPYTASVTLHVQGPEGDDAGAARNAGGDELIAVTSFVPEASAGDVSLELAVDGSTWAGQTLVACGELIGADDVTVAEAHDFDHSEASVSFPRIRVLLDDRTGASETTAKQAPTSLHASVAYAALLPGATYSLELTLAGTTAAGDAVELRDRQGNPVRAEQTFTPIDSSGSVELDLSLAECDLSDFRELEGSAELSFEGRILATSDEEDPGRRVPLVSEDAVGTDPSLREAEGEQASTASQKSPATSFTRLAGPFRLALAPVAGLLALAAAAGVRATLAHRGRAPQARSYRRHRRYVA